MTKKVDSSKHREKAERKRRRAIDAFARLQRAATLTASAADAALSPFALSASQLGVLDTLQSRGPLHQQELARTLGRSKAQMTSIIDALEKRGAASRERHATDRRFTSVHLTDEGVRLLNEAGPARETAVVAVMDTLSGDQRSRLAKLCRRIIKSLAPDEDVPDESDGPADDAVDHASDLAADDSSSEAPDNVSDEVVAQ